MIHCPTPWLGIKRGYLTDWITQIWVRWTGTNIKNSEIKWLMGPTAGTKGVGKEFFDQYCSQNQLSGIREGNPHGLLKELTFVDNRLIHPEIVNFYTHTSEYRLHVWSEWSSIFKPIFLLLSLLFSRRLKQFNMPISSMDTSLGMTSEIIQVGNSGNHLFTGWLRTLKRTNQVVYAGCYSTCTPPNLNTECIKVVFPLPNGNATVIMKPETTSKGHLLLQSTGNKIGDAGFYFLVNRDNGTTDIRYVKSMRETIEVYQGDDGLRAHHTLRYMGITFLSLHYLMTKENPQPKHSHSA